MQYWQNVVTFSLERFYSTLLNKRPPS